MSSRPLYRLAGSILVAGAVLSVAGYASGSFSGGEPVTPAMVHSTLYVVSNLLVFAGSALTLFGLPGLVARQYGRSRRLTVLGAAGLAIVTLVNGVCNTFGDLTLYPMLVDNPATRAAANGNPPPILGVLFVLGMLGAAVGAIAMAVAMFRTKLFGTWIPIVMLVTVVAGPLSSLGGALTSNLAPILGSIALFGIGIRLASTGDVAAETGQEAQAVTV
jgi:hypothetical protein